MGLGLNITPTGRLHHFDMLLLDYRLVQSVRIVVYIGDDILYVYRGSLHYIKRSSRGVERHCR